MADAAQGRLRGKSAFITGAASGMGAATARLFVAEGANVTIADLNEKAGDALAAELGPRARFERVNVTVESEVQGAIERSADACGRLDCIFNNAGFGGALGPIDETSVEDFDITFDVLLKGVFLGIKHAAPIMKRQGSGSIISTASIAGLEAGWAPHLYSTAKSAVIALTRTVALEMAEWQVRVNCICPGMIATPLAVGRGFTDEAQRNFRADMAGQQPLNRVGEPDDIARCALWLASDDSEFVTGQAHVVDGGITAGRPWRRQASWMTRNRPITVYRPPGR
ncbi:MAG: glucose 1-dehydrogenase [Gammaproteobacteria bacterium]|nr:glucose 1-dehydrogenase [Gammaproteobacteria bacterium]MYB36201.1 glucose 1-dehydrogenase [Gammaproteobacteria bacterium]